jgi:hypothetical protein
MCQYCSYRSHDGWTQLLSNDETYQTAMQAESESTDGLHESWDDLREDVDLGV